MRRAAPNATTPNATTPNATTPNRAMLAFAASIGLASIGLASAGFASPALAPSLSPDLTGRWDVSRGACAASGTSMTAIDIATDRMDTFGGNALVREVERQGAVTFVAADFQQTEGVPELGARTREHLRFTPTGPDRMTMIWKDVQTVDLVRCGRRAAANGTTGDAPAPAPAAPAAPAPPRASAGGPTEPSRNGQPPIVLGLPIGLGPPIALGPRVVAG